MKERVTAAIEATRRGSPIVIVDDFERENEGDLMIAAECITPEGVNFMIREGRGLVCLSLEREIVERLALTMQVSDNRTVFGTNFTVSIDHIAVKDCGESAAGRAHTILQAVSNSANSEEFARPGFVFPLRAVDGGVLRRRGQTEGSVDLARMAGLKRAAVICEVLDAEGTQIRGKALTEYCERFSLPMVSIEDIVQWRLQHEVALRRVAECELEIAEIPGKVRTIVYLDDVDDQEHLAFVIGNPQAGALVRVHSECLTGDVFGSRRCDCGFQLQHALHEIASAGGGVVVYLHQEGRGIGLGNKLLAYELQDRGLDTVEANVKLGLPVDNRSYRSAAHILQDLGVTKVRLVTNNPEKLESLPRFGVEVLERVRSIAPVNRWNEQYLRAKRDRLGHLP